MFIHIMNFILICINVKQYRSETKTDTEYTRKRLLLLASNNHRNINRNFRVRLARESDYFN